MKKYKLPKRLPKEFTEEWIKRLRSNEYKQGEGQLFDKRSNEYCCLGVACTIYNNEELKSIGCEFHIPYNIESPSEINIPREIRGFNEFTKILIDLNDSEGLNFNEIADWIEENIELYD